jgi:hypothetical protein
MCKQFVKDRLKAPANAEFAEFSNASLTQVATLGGKSFQVKSAVDSQNSFGAKLRLTYLCKVTNTDSDNWRLDSLTTSEQ